MNTTTPYHQFHYVREELAILPLVVIPTNVEEDDDTTTALTQNAPLCVSKKPRDFVIAAGLYSRKGLVITTLAYMEMLANTLEKDTITLVLMGMPTVMVLYSRMDPTIAIDTVWMKKLRQRGLIWPVLQSQFLKRHTVVSMGIL